MKYCSSAAWESYFRPIFCSSIGIASHMLHDFCLDTPHTANFCFWSLAIKQISNMLDFKTQALAIKLPTLYKLT